MGDEDFVVFGQPDIREEDIDEVVRTLRSLWIGTGPKTHAFEQAFAEYIGAPHAVGVNSCTAALHLALLVAGIGPGDEVIVPTLTFGATANVVVHAGAAPVFCDVDPRSRNLSAEAASRSVTQRTKAIIPVHLAGYPVDLDGLRLALPDNVRTIVDAAHAIETRYKGRALGATADVTAYSFYVTKNITTGEGGMLTTADETFAARVRSLSLHGLSQDAWSRYSGQHVSHYEVVEPGFKYNLTDLQAALGLRQLARIERSWERRREVWKRYDEAFADLPLQLPPIPEPSLGRSALHLYSPLLDTGEVPISRDEFRERLWEKGVGTGIHFTALHLHPYYRERFGFRGGEFPHAEHISSRTVSLPFSSRIRDEEIDRVIDAVRSLLGVYAR